MRKETVSRLRVHLPWLCIVALIFPLLLANPASAITRADEGTTLKLPDDAFRVPKAFLYEVKADDNLHWLAAKFYGNPRQWVKIYDSNRQKLPDPNVLEIGQQLVIPPNP